MRMKFIGPHVSIAGGVYNAPLNAQDAGAKAFGMFTKNQKQWKAKPLADEDIALFYQNMANTGFKKEHVLVHDSYLINLGNPEKEMWEKSVNAFLDEARRVEQLGLSLLNFHPGGHLGKLTDEECLDRIAEAMRIVLSETETAILVIEATAGQGSHVGYRFEHLAALIEKTGNEERTGVCIDTCHILGAGYDIRTRETYENTMEEFHRIVGFPFLKGMHLNDSKHEYANRKDRHESLGKGHIGWDAFAFIVNDLRMENIPLVLETPNPDLWPEEIKKLYALIEG